MDRLQSSSSEGGAHCNEVRGRKCRVYNILRVIKGTQRASRRHYGRFECASFLLLKSNTRLTYPPIEPP